MIRSTVSATYRSLLWMAAAAAILVACGGMPTPQRTEVDQAREALIGFFADLHAGRYAEAAEAYAGSYESLIDHNPGQDPADLAGLFRNACTINGARCLEVRSAELLPTLMAGEYRFAVEFELEDGSLFVLEPCCGGSEADFPSESTFGYTVSKGQDGRFRVLETPIYTP